MGSQLPPFTETRFCRELARISPVELPESVLHALYLHYLELRRWNPRLSLVGPGTASEILLRHYGESLAALPLIRTTDRNLVDLGSGGGFPGLVLAAACPALPGCALRVTLVESKERKWAFLRTVIRRSGLSCDCLNARVGRPLPGEFPHEIDVVTCRALMISPGLLEALCERSPRARYLFWLGEATPQLPAGLRASRELPLAESLHRRILEVCRVGS